MFSSRKWPWFFWTLVAVLITHMGKTNKLLQTTSVEIEPCTHPSWTFRIVSYDPLVAHIENFITPPERQHLLDIQEGRYRRSLVRARNGSQVENPGRTSSTGMLPRDDPTVRCIMKRAAEVQGFIPTSFIETPQVTRYAQGQEYRGHFDWDAGEDGIVTNRETTIFAVLHSSCSNCGTNFPMLKTNWDPETDELCKFFECTNTTLTTKPILGSALFWRNVLADGRGDVRTLHAGLPVPEGTKVGLNIWTKM